LDPKWQRVSETWTRASKEKEGSGREKAKGHMCTGVATLNINAPEGKISSTRLNQWQNIMEMTIELNVYTVIYMLNKTHQIGYTNTCAKAKSSQAS
jgi:hypothetical protein